MIGFATLLALSVPTTVAAGDMERDVGANAAYIESAVLHCKDYIEIDFDKLEGFQREWDQATEGANQSNAFWAYDMTFKVLERTREKSRNNGLQVHCQVISQLLDATMKTGNPIVLKVERNGDP